MISQKLKVVSLLQIIYSDILISACNLSLVVGDIAPREGIPKAEKHRLEAEAMQNFVQDMLHGSSAAQRIHSLWQVRYLYDRTHPTSNTVIPIGV